MFADLKGNITEFIFRGYTNIQIKEILTIDHNYSWTYKSEEFLEQTRKTFNTLESNEM